MIIKKRDLQSMTKEELLKKLKDLELELIKEKTKKYGQGVSIKTKEIKRTIARIKYLLNSKYNYKI